MKPTKWEAQLRHIVPDSDQRNKVIKFIKEFKKEWVVSAKNKSKQGKLI